MRTLELATATRPEGLKEERARKFGKIEYPGTCLVGGSGWRSCNRPSGTGFMAPKRQRSGGPQPGVARDRRGGSSAANAKAIVKTYHGVSRLSARQRTYRRRENIQWKQENGYSVQRPTRRLESVPKRPQPSTRCSSFFRGPSRRSRDRGSVSSAKSRQEKNGFGRHR